MFWDGRGLLNPLIWASEISDPARENTFRLPKTVIGVPNPLTRHWKISFSHCWITGSPTRKHDFPMVNSVSCMEFSVKFHKNIDAGVRLS